MNRKVRTKTCKKVSVILPAHNEEEYIGACLNSLENQTFPKEDFEIIVVDNMSTDRTADIARRYPVTLLSKPTGLVGSVRNHGFRNSSGEIIAFIDADCIAPENWIEKGVSLLSANNNYVFGGFCLLQDNPSFIERYWLLPSTSPQKDLLGAAIFIRREDFEEVGLFDEKLTSGEDSKLSRDLRKKGHTVALSSEISVAHLGNPTSFRNFVKRQIWHSENYLPSIKDSLKDPTFYLVLTWTLLLLSIIASLFIHQSSVATASLLILVIITPAILSAKRIIRSKFPRKHIKDTPYIYLLDLLYCIGRSLGLMKGFIRLGNSTFRKSSKKNKNSFGK